MQNQLFQDVYFNLIEWIFNSSSICDNQSLFNWFQFDYDIPNLPYSFPRNDNYKITFVEISQNNNILTYNVLFDDDILCIIVIEEYVLENLTKYYKCTYFDNINNNTSNKFKCFLINEWFKSKSISLNLSITA